MMLVKLTQDELDLVSEWTDARLAIKTHNKRVSKYDDRRILFMGLAGEFCAAKYLSCHFNPFPHRGGDSHQRDMWRGQCTLSVKTRHRHLSADFIYPPHQLPDARFPDDYGVVGRWQRDYWLLELVGYFTKRDFEQHSRTISVNGSRSGVLETRIGLTEQFLRPIEELNAILEQESDATILPVSDSGYVRSLWDWQDRGGGGVQRRTMCVTLADHLSVNRDL